MEEAKAFGRPDAPYLFVMLSRPSEGVMAWFWSQAHHAGIKKTECRVIFMIDEPPAGRGNKPLKAQYRSARDRFDREMAISKPRVAVPMGPEPFRALTGINESVLDGRGYVIRKHLFHMLPHEVWKQVGEYKNASRATGAKKGDPKMKWVTEARAGSLGADFDGVVIPLYSLVHVQTTGFSVEQVFRQDMRRVWRAGNGKLVEVGKKFKYVSSVDKLPEPALLGERIAIDIETHGVDNEVIDIVSFSDRKVTASLEWTAESRAYVQAIFDLPGRLIMCHNTQFDIPRLAANGVRIDRRTVNTRIFCTMFGSVQVMPDHYKGLGRVASVFLDIEPWKTASRKDNSHWRAMVNADPRTYAAKDAFYTAWLAEPLIASMKDLGAWKYYMGVDGHPGPGVMATLPELARMSRGGIPLSHARAREWAPQLERRMFRYLKLWTGMFPGVRFSSNKQLAKLLYKEWGLPVEYSREQAVSVDELALVKLQAFVRENTDDKLLPGRWRSDPRANPRTFDLMMRMREYSKLLGTYVGPVLLNPQARLHPSYLPVSKDDERGGKKMDNKGTTATGRLASFKPNIQNQPKRVRELYVPDDPSMCFVQADYKSAELYVLAGMSGDERLLADLAGDMHQKNADRLGIGRKVAKNVTYASQYLASPAKQSSMILEQEHIYISAEDCREVSEAIWGYYTKATAYKQLLVEMCTDQGFITNPFGRTRFFPSGRAPAAVDFIPQSVVADILWCVLKDVAVMLRKLGGRLVTTVHDSILACVPYEVRFEAASKMRQIMERRFDCVRRGFYIPVEIEMAEAGEPWSKVKKIELQEAA